MRKYFAAWSPCRIRKVHVEFIGEPEIYRPGSKLAGIEGMRGRHHFMGANTPKNDGATPTDGLQDVELVLKREREGWLSHRERSG